MSKYVNDVRHLSSDSRYHGVVFTGSMKNAIKQAKAAKDHGLPAMGLVGAYYHVRGMSRDRVALLQHLNLVRS